MTAPEPVAGSRTSGLPRPALRIGVLALQGDFAAHARALARLGVAPVEVRKPAELDGLAGLVIPGGESTTLLKLMGDAFPAALRAFHAGDRPIYGTCAGLILLAREVVGPPQPSLGLIDVTAERNAYGRQKESWEADAEAALGDGPVAVRMVFIRAPRIIRVGSAVRVLARWRDEPVLAREGHVLVSTFHPELTDGLAVHRYFQEMAAAG